ncbi:hypothetical protein GOODEAATRI_013918 [Goodea atripinnis]|uniref:Uncharacterized protein n=1 Tax=Goodea atripinnis TaxID=208336 RepID=A0ABV0P440_9TELE
MLIVFKTKYLHQVLKELPFCFSSSNNPTSQLSKPDVRNLSPVSSIRACLGTRSSSSCRSRCDLLVGFIAGSLSAAAYQIPQQIIVDAGRSTLSGRMKARQLRHVAKERSKAEPVWQANMSFNE